MFKNDVKLDMTKALSIRENLKKSVLITSGSNLIGAFIFFVIWIINHNIWFLSVTIILALCGIAYYFVIKAVEKKYLPDNDSDNIGMI
jgi:hypothetical protein